jgi:hypothetical protein
MSTEPTISPLQQRVQQQRAHLQNLLYDPMHRTARRIANVWGDREAVEDRLMDSMAKVPYVTFLYILDLDGKQLTSNASHNGLIEEKFGVDRSERPYFIGINDDHDMTLSEAYISIRANRPSVTAIEKIYIGEEVVGYVGADFDLRKLPITKDIYTDPSRWRQIKGDPSIRSQVFEQTRIKSRLDEQIETILPVMRELILENGVFHLKLHFSSSRATFWTMADPYRYQVVEYDDLIDPDICLAFPHHKYPDNAVVPKKDIRPILETFVHLRTADDTIYLRAGSINIFNGIIGLNFSCDGSHYIPHNEFLSRDSEFWGGM